jgi:hypothetical protein
MDAAILRFVASLLQEGIGGADGARIESSPIRNAFQ